MLSGQLIRSGNLRDYTALGGVGYPVYAAAAQIRTAVARQLGQEYADFLAIPQFDSKGETIDWYAAAADGDIVPWQAASDSERNFMRQRVAELCAGIETHARQIQASPRSNDQQVFGRLLELCTRIPDESHLYLINGKPLVTFWGFVRAGADTSKHVLSSLPAAPAAAEPVAAAVEAPVETTRRRAWWWWLLWLLLLLLLLALLLFGLRSCSAVQPYVPMLPDFLQGIVQEPKEEPAPVIGPDGKVIVPGNGVVIGPDGKVVPGTGIETGPETVPGATGDGTTEGTPPEGASPEGTPPEGATPDTTPPTPEQPGEEQKPQDNQQPDQQTPPDQQNPEQKDQQNPDQQSGDQQKPDEQKPADQQPDQQKPGEQPPAGENTPPIKPIEIPDQASSKGDPSFMEGDWRSKTGLVAKNSKGPVTMDYNFDKSGKGTTTLRMQNGVTCSGPSVASTSNGKLTVQDQGQLTCSNGQTFAGSTVTCAKDSAGQTKCTGRYPNGQTYDIMLGR